MRQFIPFAIPSGASPAVKTQTKSATITTNGESVTVEPDSGFLLSGATVTADIPTEEKTLTVTENGNYTITSSAGKLMTKAAVSVSVPTGEGMPAWIKEQSVTTFIPSSDTKEPLTVALSGMSGTPEIAIVLTSLLVPTVGETFGGGVFANNPNGIAKSGSSENNFFGPSFYRQFSGNGYVHSNSSSIITNFSSTAITITPPVYGGSTCTWIAGVTYTIIALRTKTP